MKLIVGTALRCRILVVLCGAAVLGANGSASNPPTPGSQAVDYNRDIRPILSNNCFKCHGPDAKDRQAELRLDQRAEAVKNTKSGKTAIVPGKSAGSEAIARVFSSDPDVRMPPTDSDKKLTEREKDLLKRWVDQGAPYAAHWSLQKPVRPPIPTVKNRAWVKNEIDAFVLGRLEAAGLAPSPEADRTTLIRRLSLDLRGFGPSIAEVDQFTSDKDSKAYERLVERMLASPRYGEKMAQQWLDLARFGDTSGFHADSTRQMWLWRDYVINAFNNGKPFDQFTIEQLAGDLLPNPTIEQKIASGFNRNTRFNEEGGADPDEYVIRYNIDRANTLGQVWFGMTFGCAECHSHKYDPLTQKEYYQLYAFFCNINEPMVSMNHGLPLPPLLKVPTAAQTKTIDDSRREVSEVEKKVAAELAKAVYTDPLAAKPDAVQPSTQPVDVVWIDDGAPTGAQLQGDGPTPWLWGEAPAHQVHSGKRSTKRTGAGINQHFFTGAAPPLTVSAGDKLFAYVWLDPKNPPKSVMLQFNDGSWEHRAYWGDDVGFLAGSADAANHRKAGPLPALGTWVRLEVSAQAVGLNAGAKLNGWAFTQTNGTVYYDRAGVSTLHPPDDRHTQSLFVWQQREKANAKLPGEVQTALKVEPAKQTDAQKKQIRDYYLRYAYAGTRKVFDPLNRRLDELSQTIKRTEDAIPYTMVSEELTTNRRKAFVLIRGDFLQRGEEVQPATPVAFPPMSKDLPQNRLGLARWLVSPEHPLTARVTVNRLWLQMFGTGIVKTIGDFGTQGEFPSHPELLDWLATEFVASGWNTKAMLKRIAMSATYRQSSAFGEKTPDIDPNNRLLYRAPRFRLTAEEVRDNALQIAGLLSDKLGGPSVMPYQPADFYKGKNESWPWNVADGSDLYRRGMYTFWRRTCLHPMFAVFDAPSREECAVCRPRTNTPLQALATLNDPTFVEAARVFGERVLKEGPSDVDGRLAFAFRSALTRQPTPAELSALKNKHQQLRSRFSSDAKSAAELIKIGRRPPMPNLDPIDHAVWTAIANLILNLDETITRE